MVATQHHRPSLASALRNALQRTERDLARGLGQEEPKSLAHMSKRQNRNRIDRLAQWIENHKKDTQRRFSKRFGDVRRMPLSNDKRFALQELKNFSIAGLDPQNGPEQFDLSFDRLHEESGKVFLSRMSPCIRRLAIGPLSMPSEGLSKPVATPILRSEFIMKKLLIRTGP